MKPFLRLAVAGLLIGAAQTADGKIHSIPCTAFTGDGSTMTALVSGLMVDGRAVMIQENQEIVFAEFSFEDDLPLGTEIELWPQVEGETPPWDLSAESFPFERNIWITDDRTESLVRYDVTKIVRAWESGTLPNLGFVLRITSEGNLEEQGQTGPKGIDFVAPKDATLTYHIQALRPPKDVDPVSREKRGSGKIPRGEDDGGRRE